MSNGLTGTAALQPHIVYQNDLVGRSHNTIVLHSDARLRHSADIQAVRDAKKSWRGSLLILAARKNGLPTSRFAFVCSRRIGKAVVRNRVRRLLRESIRTRFDFIEPGWDCLLIARPAIQKASFHDAQTAVFSLLGQANLLSGELS